MGNVQQRKLWQTTTGWRQAAKMFQHGRDKKHPLCSGSCKTWTENSCWPTVATKVTWLGVIFDSELTFSKHVTSVVRRCFCHTRQLCTVRKSLTTESVKILVQALIASRLDYYNSIFCRISADNLQAMQLVMNPGARLIMQKRKYEQITVTLRDDLHWLAICQRITYKWCTSVYKCLHGAAPSYLTECVFRLLPALTVIVFVQQHVEI